MSETDESTNRSAPRRRLAHSNRRLSDKILIAFHHACDQDDLEVADRLLQVLGMMLSRKPLAPGGHRPRDKESLLAAHERLWNRRHPYAPDES